MKDVGESTKGEGWGRDAARIDYVCHILPPFQNIRCFSFVKQMYLDIF
jgi:hypothetical protein